MKHSILTFIFALVTSIAYSQTFEWAKGFGGTNVDIGNSIITDALGNVYTTGYFKGTVDFDPGPNTFNLTSGVNWDVFISKLDTAGNFLWANRIGGTGYDNGSTIKLDASGNIYITGYFQGTVDFDPSVNQFNLLSAGSNDIFVAKFDGGGNFIWAKRLGGASTDNGNALALDSQGNVYTTGYFNGTADFDPSINTFNLVSAGYNNVFISKLDSNGNFVWAKSFEGNWYDERSFLSLDSQGNVYTTGYFQDTVDFDPGPNTFNLTSAGWNDVFILKLDSAGNFVWAKNMGGNNYDYAYAIALDILGNIYTTGYFSGTADFDPSPNNFNLTSAGGSDIFIAKLDNSGNFIWAKTIGGTAGDIGNSLAIDTQGNIYTTGYFQDTVDFDPGIGTYNLISAGDYDIFISKLNPSGNFIWTKSIGGIGEDQGNSLTIDTMGYVFTTGSFENIVDFDPSNGIYNLSSVGGKDIFVHKMFTCITSFDTLTITACDFYTANGQTYTMSGNYIQTLANAVGCDSILTLNLSINHSSYDTLSQIACDSLIINGQTYTTSGVYTQTSLNAIGCDSILILNLTINYSTDSTINQIACDSFTFNAQTYTTSGTYPHYFTNSNNCDSTVYLNLTISNIGTDTLIETACQYYTLNGQTYISSGIYTQAIAGCDSAITLILSLNTPTSDTITQIACDSYTLNGLTYTSSGVYQQTLTNTQGCDSILTINLSINNASYSQLNQTACNSYTLNGQTYTTSGTYTQTLTNATGCDSLLTIHLTINDTTYETLSQNGCDSIIMNGQAFYTSGTYIQTLTNSVGCDSILTLTLAIYHPQSYTIIASACDFYTSSMGNDYYTSGTYMEYIPNWLGCYDTNILILTITNGNYYNYTYHYCGSYICNGVVETSPGICYETIGCDQYEIDYIYDGPDYIDDGTITACDVYHSSIGLYFSNGVNYNNFFISDQQYPPCGVYYSVDLTIHYSTGTTLNQAVCDAYTLNGQTYTTSGTYTQYLMNAVGCDSIITLNLTITYTPNTMVTQNGQSLYANATFSTYQWIDCNGNTPILGATTQTFIPSVNGNYAVIVTRDACSDTSVCYLVTGVGISENIIQNLIQTYPNPTTDDLTIDLGAEYDIAEVKISTLVGQQLLSQKYKHSQLLAVEMPQASGIYFVSVKLENREAITMKVIKE